MGINVISFSGLGLGSRHTKQPPNAKARCMNILSHWTDCVQKNQNPLLETETLEQEKFGIVEGRLQERSCGRNI
jgi:hypothetical protein